MEPTDLVKTELQESSDAVAVSSQTEAEQFILPDVACDLRIKVEPKEANELSKEKVSGFPCNKEPASIWRNSESRKSEAPSLNPHPGLKPVPLEMACEDHGTVCPQGYVDVNHRTSRLAQNTIDIPSRPSQIMSAGNEKNIDVYKSANSGLSVNQTDHAICLTVQQNEKDLSNNPDEPLDYRSRVDNNISKSTSSELFLGCKNQEESEKQDLVQPAVEINKCFQCKQVFSDLRDLEYHIKMHIVENDVAAEQFQRHDHVAYRSDEMSHESSQSGESFASQVLSEASSSMPKELKVYRCRRCERTFSKRTDLAQHLKEHTGGQDIIQERPYKCCKCDRAFSQKSYLTKHLRFHQKCCLCEKVFPDRPGLMKQFSLPTGERIDMCIACEPTFVEKSQSDVNLLAQLAKKSHKCKQCGKEFTKKYSLNRHCLSHTEEKPHKCVHCDKSFSDKYLLRDHVRAHMRDKPFKCNQCVKAFFQESELNAHVILHTEETPHKCIHCGKGFALKCYLNRHILLHMKPPEGSLEKLPTHKCNLCEKTFTKKFHLIRHVKLHSGEKPHICHHCGRAFSQKSNLTTHILSHLGEKRYMCSHCGNVFSHKCNLIRHVKLHGIDSSDMQSQ